MTWSAAEIRALATKAARGAGAPPAQADRFGQVAALHLMAGREASALAAALDALPQGPVLSYALSVDQALGDVGRGVPAVLRHVPSDALLESYVEALPFLAHVDASEIGALKLRADLATPCPRPVARRISGCEALIAQMTALAERTFVPESDVSRRSGAGAGLTDND